MHISSNLNIYEITLCIAVYLSKELNYFYRSDLLKSLTKEGQVSIRVNVNHFGKSEVCKMGGCGSTRWSEHVKKCTVEQCLSLDANTLMREGIFQEGVHRNGVWHYLDTTTSEITSSIGYEVNTTDLAYPWIRLSYTITQTKVAVNYTIKLTITQPNFGGLRWWFVCPQPVDGRACYRRIGKIYLPPYARFYGCRHCYDLTYRSRQQSDKRVYWLRRNPDALLEIIRNRESVDLTKLFLAMKALSGRFT